jgi:hypothetical protein
MRAFFLIFSVFCLVSCHKPLTEPEEIDPIYRELMAEASNSEKSIEEQKKKIEEYAEKFEHIVPQTGQTKRVYNEYFKLKNDLASMEQKTLYYELAAKSRKYESRKRYLEAFESGKEWPDPKEYADYQTNKRVNIVNRDWRRRYPASSENSKSTKKESHKSEHAEGEGEH